MCDPLWSSQRALCSQLPGHPSMPHDQRPRLRAPEGLEGGVWSMDQPGFYKVHGCFMLTVLNSWSSTEISKSNAFILPLGRYSEENYFLKNKKFCT